MNSDLKSCFGLMSLMKREMDLMIGAVMAKALKTENWGNEVSWEQGFDIEQRCD